MVARIKYEILFWTVFFFTTSLFIVDRFTINVWPRQSFATPGHGTGTDRVGYKEGPPSVIAYQVIARLSGRYTMAALNALFFTMMHTTHFFLSDSWIGRKMINFTDDTARLRIHKWLGISLCFITLLHVWSILFPVIFSGYLVKVVLGYFSWPLSEQAPSGFKDVNSDTKTMMMQGDDVYRLILMSFLLGPIVYFSVRWLSSNYRIGIRLHQFVMLMYFIDIVRRHTHPHSWVFNTPVFFAWLTDVAWGYYLRHKRSIVQTVLISQDYMLLMWKSMKTEKKENDSIGDVYYMRCTNDVDRNGCSSSWERKHPFTSFNKRDNIISNMKLINDPVSNKLHVNSGVMTKNKSLGQHLLRSFSTVDNFYDWDRAVVLRTYTGKKSHTKLIRESEKLTMDIWGRFCSDEIQSYIRSSKDVVLIGGGSGSGYLIDTLLYLYNKARYLDGDVLPEKELDDDILTKHSLSDSTSNIIQSSKASVGLIFTTKDLALVQWWTNVIDTIVSQNYLTPSVNLNITVALTKGSGVNHGVESIEKDNINFTWGKVILGRCDMVEEMKLMTSMDMTKEGHVFCQGGLSLQNAVRKAAKVTGKIYHEGHSFDNGGSGGSNNKCCLPVSVSPV